MDSKRGFVVIAAITVVVAAGYLNTWAVGADDSFRAEVESLGHEGSGTEVALESERDETVSARAPFGIRIGTVFNPYRVFGIFVMPGQNLELEVADTAIQDYVLETATGHQVPFIGRRLSWTVPSMSGLHPVRIRAYPGGAEILVNVFVKVPHDHRNESLNGYIIGRYGQSTDPAFARPRGFVELTPETEHALISPNFTLGQFRCKQNAGYPAFVLVQERLVLKLERLLEEVNARGIETASFHVMSAFRTPHYNRAIGNRTTFSQHLYGGAADIFIDTSGNGRMDDLTGDGKVTVEDARVLAGVVEDLTRLTEFRPFIGGLGIYAPAPHRGPFIHVDVRGSLARW
jgi:hypothetical protein